MKAFKLSSEQARKRRTRRTSIYRDAANAWRLERSILEPDGGWVEQPVMLFYSRASATVAAREWRDRR